MIRFSYRTALVTNCVSNISWHTHNKLRRRSKQRKFWNVSKFFAHLQRILFQGYGFILQWRHLQKLSRSFKQSSLHVYFLKQSSLLPFSHCEQWKRLLYLLIWRRLWEFVDLRFLSTFFCRLFCIHFKIWLQLFKLHLHQNRLQVRSKPTLPTTKAWIF